MLSSTSALLGVVAVCEVAVGLLLLSTPSWTSQLLLGAGLASPESVIVGRMAGAALLSLGVICWLSRTHRDNGPTSGLIAGLLVYNAAAVALLAYGGVVEKFDGIGIWPTLGLHLALLMWCLAHLRTGVPSR
jgi:hypothetical protein